MHHRYLVAICFIGLVAAPALAQQRPTFSIDFQGPTAGQPDAWLSSPITEGDILTTAPPGPPGPNPARPAPPPPPGIMVGALAGAAGSFPGGLGIIPGGLGFVELDALSYGRDAGVELFFSVDEFATGFPGLPPDVFSEGVTGAAEASADVFIFGGPVVATPPGPSLGNRVWNDGNGLAPPVPPLKGYALVEPNPPTPGVIPDPGDNLDAIDIDSRVKDFAGFIYFSLDGPFVDAIELAPVNTGTAMGNGFSGADVLVSPVGGAPALSCPAATLGLDLSGWNNDDLDALIFNDTDGSTTCTPGVDTLYFSVRRSSAVIGVPDSCFGVPIEEGDVLTFPAVAGLPPCLFIAAEALGLGTVRSGSAGAFGADDLDALDVAPPLAFPAYPTWVLVPLAALLLSTGGWLAQRRRQRRA